MKQDVTLQETMDSDPVTLQEEYEIQKIWVEDKNRCVFIILDPLLPEAANTRGRGGGMAGEVILFLSEQDDKRSAQIEVTIAEVRSRRRGIASEAVILSMLYAMTVLERTEFIAKIGFKNLPSQQLFQKLGFREQGRSAVFKELTYMLEVLEATKQRILEVIAITLPPYISYDSSQETSWQPNRPVRPPTSSPGLQIHHHSGRRVGRSAPFRFS